MCSRETTAALEHDKFGWLAHAAREPRYELVSYWMPAGATDGEGVECEWAGAVENKTENGVNDLVEENDKGGESADGDV